MRLINADALIERFWKDSPDPEGVADWVAEIEKEPTVQVDAEYISKEAVLETIDKWYEDKADIEDLIVKITYIQGVAIPNKVGHWVETGRMFVEPNDDQILYEYICDSCKGLAYFRKSMDDLVGAKYCPCCNSPMEIER